MINRDKLVSFLAIVSVGAVALFVSKGETRTAEAGEAAPVLPSVSAVLPDPLPLDSVILPSPVQTARETRIVVPRRAPRKGKAWTCGAPHALENEATQTVKDCYYK